MATPSLSAVLLAAGRSTRMGRDKALLASDDGRPLWARQREVLAAAGAAEIFLSARAEQAWAERAEGFSDVVRDARADCGPLGGIVAALARARHRQVAVLAIDLPRMEAAWFGELVRICAPGVGAVGRSDGRFEPLAAIYPREILPEAQAALAQGELSLQRLLASAEARGTMRVRDIAVGERRWFANWNEGGEAAFAG
jgi:molybdenum cofactor guanylyltransferase